MRLEVQPPEGAAGQDRQRLGSIQILRAIAALMVVWHHAIKAYTLTTPDFARGLAPSPAGEAWFREGLSAGVDVFFVISGFIMVHGARRYAQRQSPPRHFLFKRFQRIYPGYWAASLLMLALLFGQTRGTSFDFEPKRLVSAFLLFPTRNAHEEIQPILGVGWTLSYELYFYLMFFLSLQLAGQRYLTGLVMGIGTVWLVAVTLPNGSALREFLANPLVFEFVMGGLAAALLRQRRLPPMLTALAPVALTLILGTSALEQSGAFAPPWRALYWGLPAVMLLIAALALPLPSESRLVASLVRLGDASYSLYLIHIPVIYYLLPPLLRPLAASGLIHTTEPLILLSLAGSVLAGLLFYHGIERPLATPRVKAQAA